VSAIIHLIGPSCSGKSTLLKRLIEIDPINVGGVKVGEYFRKRYGEARFKGQAAPLDTQDEAWHMYTETVGVHLRAKKKLIIVDGQPRDVKQACEIPGLWKFPHRTFYIILTADHKVREARCRADKNPERRLEDRLARLTNDYRNCYVAMTELLKADQVLRVIDTSCMMSIDGLAERLLSEYMV